MRLVAREPGEGEGPDLSQFFRELHFVEVERAWTPSAKAPPVAVPLGLHFIEARWAA